MRNFRKDWILSRKMVDISWTWSTKRAVGWKISAKPQRKKWRKIIFQKKVRFTILLFYWRWFFRSVCKQLTSIYFRLQLLSFQIFSLNYCWCVSHCRRSGIGNLWYQTVLKICQSKYWRTRTFCFQIFTLFRYFRKTVLMIPEKNTTQNYV